MLYLSTMVYPNTLIVCMKKERLPLGSLFCYKSFYVIVWLLIKVFITFVVSYKQKLCTPTHLLSYATNATLFAWVVILITTRELFWFNLLIATERLFCWSRV